MSSEDQDKKKVKPIEIFDLVVALTLISITSLAVTKLVEEVIDRLPIKERHRVTALFIWAVLILGVTLWFLFTRIKDNEFNPGVLLGA